MAEHGKFIAGKTGNVERKYMVLYVDISDPPVSDPADADWAPVGYKTPSAALELNPEQDDYNDVLGLSHTDVTKLAPTMTFDPVPMQADSKLHEKIIQTVIVKKDLGALSKWRTMLTYGFMNSTGIDDGTYDAEVQENCTIIPESLGGEDIFGLPFTVSFSQKSIWGTVDSATFKDGIVFEPDTVTP